ncbi:MAG: hypothetical protein ACRDH6_10165 [Actinomycetota bacterium]
MIALPILSAAVSTVFGVHLLLRFLRRGAVFEGVWALALLMYAAASAALAAGVAGAWAPAEFRIYWLFGAVLNVPYLAQGEIYLLVRNRKVAHALMAVVLLGTIWATAEIRTAPLNGGVLATEEFFSGRKVLGVESAGVSLARLYSLPAYGVLVAGVLWSAWKMRGRRELASRFRGTLLILLGATIVAVGSVFARSGNFAGFSGTLAGGVAVMYGGFLTATRPPPNGP